jgi:hypothetical protein
MVDTLYVAGFLALWGTYPQRRSKVGMKQEFLIDGAGFLLVELRSTETGERQAWQGSENAAPPCCESC